MDPLRSPDPSLGTVALEGMLFGSRAGHGHEGKRGGGGEDARSRGGGEEER